MSDTVNLENGQKAPTFRMNDSDGNMHDLEAINASGKTVILYFYPRDSTPGCTVQACDFRDQMGRLNNNQYLVLGVSIDSTKSHEDFITEQQLNFSLLLDEDKTLHNAYGTWRLKTNYGKEYMGCARSTFVINPQGDLIFARYNVKAKNHVEMLIRELNIAE
ncbi:MAG: peroxiredoxin [Candidatus Poseidoniaceae archaeon]|jgi:peroxiredoxin Q/BCP|tara:strand:- start:1378 stop:1863 length:486 start_codon:yes stop_codon:yes gene_type:complete